jgi:hypothetical protein
MEHALTVGQVVPAINPVKAECDKGLYMPLEMRGYIIDSQTFGKKMKKPHHTARAGLTQDKATTDDTMKFDCEAITLQITQDFEKEHSYFKDDKEDSFGPHRKTDAIRDIIQDFFQECDELLNQKRIRQQQECVGWDPEENVQANDNPTKKTSVVIRPRRMRIHEYTVRVQFPRYAHSLL